MEQQNIFEKSFLGKEYKKALIILYASLFLIFCFYFLGEILGKALFYISH
ncbi:hypothetical protein NLG42_15270 [Flavobacterium plurextorum]|nr:hypothetical protein [Flavobacterium plurextorum]UUW07460.1 hypothetical protein NLG42_15270 [Flavobacterium plurextorum]